MRIVQLLPIVLIIFFTTGCGSNNSDSNTTTETTNTSDPLTLPTTEPVVDQNQKIITNYSIVMANETNSSMPLESSTPISFTVIDSSTL